VPLPANIIKTRLAITAPPIINDDELKENWSRIPFCSMIQDFFFSLTTKGGGGISMAMGSFGSSW